jgi:hypothetical protein
MLTRYLQQLTGTDLSAADPARRLSALAKLDPAKDRDKLLLVMTEDTEEAVREAALRVLADPRLCLEQLATPGLGGPARTVLAELLGAGAPLEPLMAGLDETGLRRLVDACREPAHFEPVLAALQEEDTFAHIASRHPAAPVRAAAAARVTRHEALRTLEKQVRSKDKAVAQQLRARLDHYRAARKETDALALELESQAQRLLAHAQGTDDGHLLDRYRAAERQRAEYRGTLAALAQTLRHFGDQASAFDQALQAFDQALGQLDARLAEEQRAAAAAAALEAAAAAKRDQLKQQLEALEGLLTDAELRISRGEGLALSSTLSAALRLEGERWDDALSSEPSLPDAVLSPLKKTFSHLHSRLSERLEALERLSTASPLPEAPEALPELPEHPPKDPEAATALWASAAALGEALEALDRWVSTLAWPREGALPPEAMAARRQREALSQRARALDALAQRAQERAEKRVQRFERALSSEQAKAAGGMLAELKTLHPALPPVFQGGIDLAELEARYQALREQLFEASLEAREALIGQLETLAATPLEAAAPAADGEGDSADDAEDAGKARAEAVKALRSAWNGLGPLRGEAGKALQKRFDDAAEAAFEPARAAFEAQSQQRAANTAAREALLKTLEATLDAVDWEAPDWKALDRLYRESNAAWRQHEPVDNSGRRLAGPFFSRMRGLKSQLEARWQANIAAKRALVAEAEALAQSDGGRDAAEQCKALQRRWAEIDITPRKLDRALWTTFRSHCDAIFGNLQKARTEAKQAADAESQALRTLTEQVRAGLAAAEDEAALQALPLGALRQALKALPRRGPRSVDAARQAAEKTLDAVKHAKGRFARRQATAQLASILELDQRCCEAEAAGQALPESDDAALKAALEARAQGAPDNAARREACIDLEMALGVESPASDAQLRLARQVARLASGLGKGPAEDDPQQRATTAALRLLATAMAGDEGLALAQRARDALATGG